MAAPTCRQRLSLDPHPGHALPALTTIMIILPAHSLSHVVFGPDDHTLTR